MKMFIVNQDCVNSDSIHAFPPDASIAIRERKIHTEAFEDKIASLCSAPIAVVLQIVLCLTVANRHKQGQNEGFR